jgi:hypothetical protein
LNLATVARPKDRLNFWCGRESGRARVSQDF